MEAERRSAYELRASTTPKPEQHVFVVDDDDSVRKSLEMLIRTAGWQAQTFGSATEFLARASPQAPSCLVLDVSLPDVNGLDVQERVACNRAGMPIIFITGFADAAMAVRAMKAGAAEFLMKPFRNDVVLSAIANALEQSRAALVREAEMRSLRERYASLTRREREVVALVVEGRLNKQVADALKVTEATVKAHRGHAMQKMKARSLPDLVKMAARLDSP